MRFDPDCEFNTDCESNIYGYPLVPGEIGGRLGRGTICDSGPAGILGRIRLGPASFFDGKVASQIGIHQAGWTVNSGHTNRLRAMRAVTMRRNAFSPAGNPPRPAIDLGRHSGQLPNPSIRGAKGSISAVFGSSNGGPAAVASAVSRRGTAVPSPARSLAPLSHRPVAVPSLLRRGPAAPGTPDSSALGTPCRALRGASLPPLHVGIAGTNAMPRQRLLQAQGNQTRR